MENVKEFRSTVDKAVIKVIRSKRKSLSLSVGENGEAVVRAPNTATEAEIEAFVARHRRWLFHRLSERERSRLCYDTGATLSLFGKAYRVADGKTKIEGDTLYLPAEERETALIALAERLAKEYLGVLTERIAHAYGFEYSSVRISHARSRWGSCNRKGAIAYTFRLAFLPSELIEYVVVHELCHTRVFNHGVQFWRILSSVLPDCQARRKRLRQYGGVMDAFGKKRR